MNRIGMFPLSKYKASKVVLLCQHFQALISPSILVGVYFLNFLPTFISSKLKLLQVSLSVEMSSGKRCPVTVTHTDLIVHHPQGRNRILTFVIIQIIRQIVCLCYTVHRDGTLQGGNDLTLSYHFLYIHSLGDAGRGLHSHLAEGVTVVGEVQQIIIHPNVACSPAP